jgi:HSP20 family protein
MSTLTRWDPFQQMERLEHEMERLFARVPVFDRGSTWLPAVDVEQTPGKLVFTFDIPGMKREDVTIELHDRILTVSGVREQKQDERHEGYFTHERVHGEFARSFTLPDGVKPEDVEAVVSDGELRITVRRPEEASPKRIEIAEAA